MIKKLDFPKVEKIGIYAIRNKKNNKYYIGAASNIAARLEKHEVEGLDEVDQDTLAEFVKTRIKWTDLR